MADEIDVIEREGYLEARFLGGYSLKVYKLQMTMSVQACLNRNFSRVLVDLTGLTGYAPSSTERFEIGEHGAEISRTVRVAALKSPSQLGDSLASTVAQNRGVPIEVFVDRAKAVEWLLGTS